MQDDTQTGNGDSTVSQETPTESSQLQTPQADQPVPHEDQRTGAAQDTRRMSRGMALVDHLERDGVAGFLSITGGKLTTYRLMAGTVDRKSVG